MSSDPNWKRSIWRGDRDASCTPSGKGRRGIVAVYLTKRKRAFVQMSNVDARLSIGCKRFLIKRGWLSDWHSNFTYISDPADLLQLIEEVLRGSNIGQLCPRVSDQKRRCVSRTAHDCIFLSAGYPHNPKLCGTGVWSITRTMFRSA